MSNRSKGARLYLKAAQRAEIPKKSRLDHRGRSAQISTGCGADDLAQALKKSPRSPYRQKHGIVTLPGGDPLSTAVSDVIGLYARTWPQATRGRQRPPAA